MDGHDGWKDRYGPWAVVAGGSEGLGAAFAELIAARGVNLLLVARRPDVLERTRESLRARHPVEVETLPADLADPSSITEIMRRTAGREVGLLVCDAAVSTTGPFLRQDLQALHRMLDVNCRSALDLMHGFGAAMAERGRGGIIVMSSMAAFQGSPVVAAYGATKSFLLSLAEGVGDELAPSGVDVLACCPAVILTPHFMAETRSAKAPLALRPDAVASQALAGLGRRRIVVPGAMGRLVRFMTTRLMPRAAVVRMMGRSTRAMYREGPR
jgi:uncharacterized protein